MTIKPTASSGVQPMMKTIFATLLVLSASLASATDAIVHRDLAYTESPHERQQLDIYQPAAGNNHPVMIWIHGGGWRIGDKRSVQEKPKAFVEQGFVFVSINYRFVPDVSMREIAQDVAQAIAWTHAQAEQYGGDPDQLFVGGHSAGAHLSALVCTDQQYLAAKSLSLANIKGCIPVDTAVYDAAKQIRDRGRFRSRNYTAAFGNELASQKEYSPINHVEKDKGIPPFLILHVASRKDSSAQSQAFARALREAAVTAKVVAGHGKDHASINRELGLPGDEPTKAVFEFLKELIK